MTTELAIRPEQTSFDAKQRAALASVGVQNASDADVALFFHQAARTGLDPFARQIYLINRGGKQTIQVGIDGFRLIRDRKGTYQGHDEEWCGPDEQWRDVWLDAKHAPAAARVSVYVAGYQRPVVGIALWSEYAQLGRDGKPQSVWASKPALMLAKCAEALALRKAYPQDLSGLYTSDEIPAAEQDADGVYVTTMMRDTPAESTTTPTAPKVAKSTRAKETEVESRSEAKPTRAPAGRPGPSRPASQSGPGRADPAPEELDEWLWLISDSKSWDELRSAHIQAERSGILDQRTRYDRTIEDHFLARKAELDTAAQQRPQVVEYDDDASAPF